MRKLSLLILAIAAALLAFAACAGSVQEDEESGYALYFLSDLDTSGGGDAIAASSLRFTPDEAMSTEDCVRALMELLLAGPDEATLHSPIPEGTALRSLSVSGRRARVDLSITVQFYFLDSKTGELRAEQQTLALYEGQTRVNALLEALAQGPEDDALLPLLPEDFSISSSRIEDGVCYLSIPANAALPEDENTRGLLFESLERSVLSLSGVDEVQLVIEGKNGVETTAVMDASKP